MAQLTVSIQYLGLLRNTVGRAEEEISVPQGALVEDVMKLLGEKHGEQFTSVVFRSDGRLRALTQVVVDGNDIRDGEGLKTKLKGGDKISVIVGIYPISGGDGI